MKDSKLLPDYSNKSVRKLCKFRGMLVIMEGRALPAGKIGKCPDCGSSNFAEHAGWAECNNCNFAMSI